MPNTLKDFWTMILERNIQVIVCLNDIPLTDEVSTYSKFQQTVLPKCLMNYKNLLFFMQ